MSNRKTCPECNRVSTGFSKPAPIGDVGNYPRPIYPSIPVVITVRNAGEDLLANTDIPISETGNPPPGLSPDCEWAWRYGYYNNKSGFSFPWLHQAGDVSARVWGCYEAGARAGQEAFRSARRQRLQPRINLSSSRLSRLR